MFDVFAFVVLSVAFMATGMIMLEMVYEGFVGIVRAFRGRD